jgi:hypothetical protein
MLTAAGITISVSPLYLLLRLERGDSFLGTCVFLKMPIAASAVGFVLEQSYL